MRPKRHRQARLRRITELCLADHQDNPAILQKWVANKIPANLRSWMPAN